MSTNTSMESGIEAGVLPTVTGSLASARDSLGSLSRAAEPMYDTDHTDLGSELDEAEIRRELMHDAKAKVGVHAQVTGGSLERTEAERLQWESEAGAARELAAARQHQLATLSDLLDQAKAKAGA